MYVNYDTAYKICPDWSFAKKAVTRSRIRSFESYYISEEEVAKGEADPGARAAIVER